MYTFNRNKSTTGFIRSYKMKQKSDLILIEHVKHRFNH